MSTKATIAYGNNFHLYKEVLDEDFIYLLYFRRNSARNPDSGPRHQNVKLAGLGG